MKHTNNNLIRQFRYYLIVLASLLTLHISAANKVRIFGYVMDEFNKGIELADVFVMGTTQGTTTNKNGYFNLELSVTDSVSLRFSMVGYVTIINTLLESHIPSDGIVQMTVVMPTDITMLDAVEVTGHNIQTSQMEALDARAIRLMPDATGGSIESLLVTFAGVTQTNELSSQYSVRGGNFDENSVYVNGIEVYRPQLIRAGQQEGLSFVNPNMVDQLQFAAGGFDATYADKSSSILDITYKKPQRTEGVIDVSLLGASAYFGAGNERFTQMHGIRYKTNQYMLGSLDTKGTYRPNFLDYQTYMTWQLDKNRKWELALLGNYSQNIYKFIPTESSSAFGTFSSSRQLTTYFDGQEQDVFRTAFAALQLNYRPNRELRFGIDISGYYSHERERYDITGQYILTDSPQDNSQQTTTLGVGTYHQHARNQLRLAVVNVAHSGQWKRGENTLRWGIGWQGQYINDRIGEWQLRDSAGYSLPQSDRALLMYYNMHSDANMHSNRMLAYINNSHRFITDHGNLYLNTGVRANYWDFTGEFIASPRASLTYLPTRKRDFALRLATGLYYQTPFYKELRDTLTDVMGVTRMALNDNLKSQRSVHAIIGADYYFRAFGRPFKLTAEAYYKYADRVISYTIDNVQIRYSGRNDAVAYTTGVDLKLYGELVPGADSWISLSYMRSRENLLNDNRGWIPRPNEQQYSISVFFQDYMPRHPEYRLHLKFIWAQGFPFGPPRNQELRAAARSRDYRRVDLGVSRTFSDKTDKFMRKPSARHIDYWTLQIDLFNLLNLRNVDSYYWITDIYANQYAVPNYLTGFLFNFRISVGFR